MATPPTARARRATASTGGLLEKGFFTVPDLSRGPISKDQLRELIAQDIAAEVMMLSIEKG